MTHMLKRVATWGGLMKRSHICLNPNSVEMSKYDKRNPFTTLATVSSLETLLAQNPCKTLTCGECNNIVVRETRTLL